MSDKNAVTMSGVIVTNAEVKSEPVVALVELTDAQAKAVHMMGKSEELDAIAKATLAARIKGDFKRYREAITKVNGDIYDRAMRSGFKIELSKDEYLKKYAAEANAVWNELA